MTIMPPPRQLLLLATLSSALAACLLPAPCAAGKWTISSTNFASVSLTDSSDFFGNSLFLTQTVPADVSQNTAMGTSLFLSGTLALPSNTSEPVLLSIQGSSFIPGASSVPPAITSSDYKRLGQTATLTASLQNFPVQGCIGACSFPPADDEQMLLDLEWVAKGERLSAFGSDMRFSNIDYRTKPPSRFGSTSKGEGAQYLSRDVAHLRVRRTTPEGNVFEGTFSCQSLNGGESCTYSLSVDPSRSFARIPRA